LRASYNARPTMPVVNSEVCYEALSGRISAEVVRLMFWADVLSGAAGHTYGANGIWQLNRKGKPYGKSPHGGDYGPIPWDEAMQLPGSRQLGHAKQLLQKYPWHRFEPHPEWATWKETKAGERDAFLVPYAAGIPGTIRIVYLPRPLVITVHKLESSKRYLASYFDPVSGRRTEIGPVRPDDRGNWMLSPPQKKPNDWVLLLETHNAKP
jgi:Protein of unknown function (DUF4038)/Putative collagen-binding domain of a collagenase